jgi:hypothetical protein
MILNTSIHNKKAMAERHCFFYLFLFIISDLFGVIIEVALY